MFFFPGDQVEHAHDNPLDEIMLGEDNTTATMKFDEVPSQIPNTPKKMNLEIDKEPEVKCEVENNAQGEGKKPKKKDVKKEKAKGKKMQSRIFDSNVMSLFLLTCLCVHAN